MRLKGLIICLRTISPRLPPAPAVWGARAEGGHACKGRQHRRSPPAAPAHAPAPACIAAVRAHARRAPATGAGTHTLTAAPAVLPPVAWLTIFLAKIHLSWRGRAACVHAGGLPAAPHKLHDVPAEGHGGRGAGSRWACAADHGAGPTQLEGAGALRPRSTRHDPHPPPSLPAVLPSPFLSTTSRRTCMRTCAAACASAGPPSQTAAPAQRPAAEETGSRSDGLVPASGGGGRGSRSGHQQQLQSGSRSAGSAGGGAGGCSRRMHSAASRQAGSSQRAADTQPAISKPRDRTSSSSRRSVFTATSRTPRTSLEPWPAVGVSPSG